MIKLDKSIEKLRKTEDLHIRLAKEMLLAYGANMYGLDFLMLAAMNRSRCNTSAFIDLIEKNNYISAAPMVRMQVDTILRLEASRLVDDPHKFSVDVMGGTSIRNMKDNKNKKMTDAYLLNKCKNTYPWIENVYKEGSGFIHLSEKHIFGVISEVGENGTINMQISEKQDFVPESIKIEAVEAFYKTVETIFELCEGWIFTKKNPELAKKLYQEQNA